MLRRQHPVAHAGSEWRPDRNWKRVSDGRAELVAPSTICAAQPLTTARPTGRRRRSGRDATPLSTHSTARPTASSIGRKSISSNRLRSPGTRVSAAVSGFASAILGENPDGHDSRTKNIGSTTGIIVNAQRALRQPARHHHPGGAACSTSPKKGKVDAKRSGWGLSLVRRSHRNPL